MLISGGGHYLIYGSEYLCGIATTLFAATGIDYHRRLRRRGTPTIVVAALPTAEIPMHERIQFAAILCDELAAVPSHRRTGTRLVDFTFSRTAALPASCIYSCYHPNDIPDPLNGDRRYRWRHADHGSE